MEYTGSAIVTGGTMGLGYHAATEIARKHPDWLVVLCSRTDKEHAADSVNKTLRQNNVIFLPLDLSDTKNVRAFVDEWTSKNYPPLRALLLNAGLQFPKETVFNGEGIEATFAVNHVGHTLLFHLLCPLLARNARVLVTASGVHDPAQKSGLPDATYTSAEDLAHPPPAMTNRPGTGHYANSKLANIMWTYALDKRLRERVPDRGITVNAFVPGLMLGTGLAREHSPAVRFVFNHVMPCFVPVLKVAYTHNIHPPAESGASLARLAVGDDVAGVSGKYYEGRKEIQSSVPSYTERFHDDLWKWTIKHLAQDEAQAARFEGLK